MGIARKNHTRCDACGGELFGLVACPSCRNLMLTKAEHDGFVAGQKALLEAATFARDMIARWLYEEDDSGDDNDLADAYEALKAVLGPTTEEGLGETLAVRAALASTEEPQR